VQVKWFKHPTEEVHADKNLVLLELSIDGVLTGYRITYCAYQAKQSHQAYSYTYKTEGIWHDWEKYDEQNFILLKYKMIEDWISKNLNV